jgi:hypothetical protein
MQINSVTNSAELTPPNTQPGDRAHRVLIDAKAVEGTQSTDSKREVAKSPDTERLKQALNEHNISL